MARYAARAYHRLTPPQRRILWQVEVEQRRLAGAAAMMGLPAPRRRGMITAAGNPAWLEPLSVLGGLEIGAFSITIAWAGLWLQRRHYVDGQYQRRAAQAEKVAAWFTDDGGAVWQYHLRNASDIPVYDVRVVFSVGHLVLGRDELQVLPPGHEPLTRKVPDRIMKEARALSGGHGHDLRVWLGFHDAAGRPWVRDKRGRLRYYPLPLDNPRRRFLFRRRRRVKIQSEMRSLYTLDL